MAEHDERRGEQLVNRPRKAGGFTLIELTIIILILGVIAGVAIPRFGGMSEAARTTATQEEMRRLKTAIVGTVGSDGVPRGGYELDVGHAPNRLRDLVTKPDSVNAWNRFIDRGWNGPYVDSAEGSYLTDAWDSTYRYSVVARTITSTGSASIVLSF